MKSTKSRIGLSSLAIILATPPLGLIGANSAQAASYINCRDVNWQDASNWEPIGSLGANKQDKFEYTLYSATPTFNVSDSRIAQNNTAQEVNTTFTSSQSKTFTLSVSASVSASFLKFLSASVSATITNSRTTQIGVSVTTPVPAGKTVQGDYGVQAYNINAAGVKYTRIWPKGAVGANSYQCQKEDISLNNVNAPTNIEGWKVSVQ